MGQSALPGGGCWGAGKIGSLGEAVIKTATPPPYSCGAQERLEGCLLKMRKHRADWHGDKWWAGREGPLKTRSPSSPQCAPLHEIFLQVSPMSFIRGPPMRSGYALPVGKLDHLNGKELP